MPTTAKEVDERQAVPAFGLYGEAWSSQALDRMHWESIPARSRLHGWRIQPHRHSDLLQLMYVQRGPARLMIDADRHLVDRPTLVLLPPLSVHGFDFSRRVQGHVLTLDAPVVSEFSGRWPLSARVLSRPACLAAGEEAAMLDQVFAAVADEYRGRRPARAAMLQALVSQLLVWTWRACLLQEQPLAESGSTPDARAARYLRSYLALVDTHFRQQWPLQRYAQQVGVSTGHLNAVCRGLAGASALQLLQRRRLLEAQRSLTYTSMDIQQVAASLGFSDAAYFSRWFSRNAGCAPRDFRQRSRGRQHGQAG
jgi:AraC family transcriptional activator of pobA